MKPNFKEKKSISEKVADYIKEQIRIGVYSAGEKIIGERDMAIQLGVSRNTVREAYKILEAYGYLKAEHGRGVFIAPEVEQIKKMTDAFFVSSHQLRDLFAVRKVLEETMVEWATENATPAHIQELEQIVKDALEIVDEGGNPVQLAEYDLKFHLCLAKMSQNVVADRIMHHLIDLLAQARTQSIRIPNRAAKSVREHQEIVHAIKTNDTQKAKEAMKAHLESVEQAIAARLNEEEQHP